MKTLGEIIKDAEKNHVAIGHFNISDFVALKAIMNAALRLSRQGGFVQGDTPIIIGVSEGEREFLGVKTISAVIRSLREEFNYPIFLNADHTHTLEGVKEAVEADFDSIIFDGSKLSFKENIRQTKEAVEYIKSKNPRILAEGELGYIGGSSQLLDAIPEGAQVKGSNITTPKEAKQFVEETKVDLFAPAVGNVHGMLKDASEPALNIERIKEIHNAVSVPLVLHGGSGSRDQEFIHAIQAGISIIHISTQIRKAWRDELEKSLAKDPNEVAPYHLLAGSVAKIQEIVEARLKLFNGG